MVVGDILSICPECSGTGKINGGMCSRCLGSGKVDEVPLIPPPKKPSPRIVVNVQVIWALMDKNTGDIEVAILVNGYGVRLRGNINNAKREN